MFLKKFIKIQFVSFFYDEKYKLLSEIYKNDKLLEENRIEFDEKDSLLKKIKELSEEIPQTYVSTILQTINQGVISGCHKDDFEKNGIKVENIQYVCIDNKYSIYTSLYDLLDLKKLEVDFIYSVFAIIDYKAKKRVNTLYVLVTRDKFYLLIYNKDIPVYSDIYEKASEDLVDNDLDLDEFDDGEIVDIEDEILEDLDNIDDEIEEIEPEEKEIKTGTEMDVVNFIKSAIEDYYKSYGDDFLENIVIYDIGILNKDVVKIINDMLFIEAEIEKIDILKIINEISRQYV